MKEIRLLRNFRQRAIIKRSLSKISLKINKNKEREYILKFKGLEVDFTQLAALVASITGLILAIKGLQQRKKDNKKKEENNG